MSKFVILIINFILNIFHHRKRRKRKKVKLLNMRCVKHLRFGRNAYWVTVKNRSLKGKRFIFFRLFDSPHDFAVRGQKSSPIYFIFPSNSSVVIQGILCLPLIHLAAKNLQWMSDKETVVVLLGQVCMTWIGLPL